MMRKLVPMLILLSGLFGFAPAAQSQSDDNGDVVDMSGISIIGNRELPKTLFIVPWKNSEVNVEADLTNSLNEGLRPLDQEVFRRELEYYEFSHSAD